MNEALLVLIARFAVSHNLVWPCGSLTEYLIANDVTVQQWIHSSDRAPTEADADEHGNVLVHTSVGMTYAARYTSIKPDDDFYIWWTKMPKPSKKEK